MIKIRFSRGDGLAGAVVRAVTWSDYAHVGFKLRNGLVLDATPQYGVSVREAKDDAHTRYFAVRGVASLQAAKVLEFAWSQEDQPYDWTGALGVGFHRDWRRSGRWDCAELVAAAMEHAGYPLIRQDHLDRVTPESLLLSPYLIPLPVPAGGGWSAGTLHAAS